MCFIKILARVEFDLLPTWHFLLGSECGGDNTRLLPRALQLIAQRVWVSDALQSLSRCVHHTPAVATSHSSPIVTGTAVLHLLLGFDFHMPLAVIKLVIRLHVLLVSATFSHGLGDELGTLTSIDDLSLCVGHPHKVILHLLPNRLQIDRHFALLFFLTLAKDRLLRGVAGRAPRMIFARLYNLVKLRIGNSSISAEFPALGVIVVRHG